MKKIPIGILGATGVIGQEYIRLLQNHPWFEITFLAASDKRVGETSSNGLKISHLEDIEKAKSQCRFIFSALPNSIAQTLDLRYSEAGLPMLSHASCHRMKEDVPLIIPEINSEHLDQLTKGNKGFIIAKPNCALMAFLMPLAPLHKRFQLKKVFVTTMQAISGAGKESLSAMDIHDNVIPYIADEEEKIQIEPLKILNDPTISISAQCNRVPTLHGHFACVSAAFTEKPNLEEVVKIWNEFPGLDLPTAPKRPLIYSHEEKRPQTRLDLHAEAGMGVTIGRLRPCLLFDMRFVALSHNALRGGAGGGLLIAELLHKKGLL